VATLVVMNLVAQMALKDVKNHLSEVVDKVEREHERVVITKHGRPAAVVVSVDDLESLEQTLDILSRPALIKQIRESLVELRDEGAQALSKDEALALIPRS
jgi:antitoxin YefM